MPTYEYRRADGSTFEFFQRISDEPLETDPETGQPVERLISGGAGLQFKGSGFYLTDYVHTDRKSTASPPDSPNGSDSESLKSESGSNDSTETSPATSSDAD